MRRDTRGQALGALQRSYEDMSAPSLLLDMCNLFTTIATFKVIPGYTSRLLGRGGFGPVAGLYREIAREFTRIAHRFCCDKLDPLGFLENAARVNSEAGGSFTLMPLKVRRTDNGAELVYALPKTVESLKDTDRALLLAPILGLVAGVYEAAGYTTLVASTGKHLPCRRGLVRVYLAEQCDRTVVIRVDTCRE